MVAKPLLCKMELRPREVLHLIPYHTAKYWQISSENLLPLPGFRAFFFIKKFFENSSMICVLFCETWKNGKIRTNQCLASEQNQDEYVVL